MRWMKDTEYIALHAADWAAWKGHIQALRVERLDTDPLDPPEVAPGVVIRTPVVRIWSHAPEAWDPYHVPGGTTYVPLGEGKFLRVRLTRGVSCTHDTLGAVESLTLRPEDEVQLGEEAFPGWVCRGYYLAPAKRN